MFSDIKPSKSIKSCRHLRRRDGGIVSVPRAAQANVCEARGGIHLWVAKWKIVTYPMANNYSTSQV